MNTNNTYVEKRRRFILNQRLLSDLWINFFENTNGVQHRKYQADKGWNNAFSVGQIADGGNSG